MTCIGTPISWLRLETFAAGARDAAIAEHVAACPACASCLAELRDSAIDLPRLAVPAAAPKRRWVWWLAPAMAAALIAVLWIRRPTDPERDLVKGSDVAIQLVRERAGTIRTGATTYAPGDRFKVVVTCPPDGLTWLDVSVEDAGQLDFPLAPSFHLCGNNRLLPGAFTITGDRPNTVCVRVAPDAPPPRTGGGDAACLTLTRE